MSKALHDLLKGFFVFSSNTNYRHEYAIKDHLGNIRLWVSDLDSDGILEIPSEILQKKHYYPFGMAMESYSYIYFGGKMVVRKLNNREPYEKCKA